MSNNDYSNREVLEAVYDIRDRVTRIEEKLNRAERVEEKVNILADKQIAIKDLAEDALNVSEQNKKDIEALELRLKDEIKSYKSFTYSMVTIVIAVAGVVSTYFGIK